jgi:hypothetical protein
MGVRIEISQGWGKPARVRFHEIPLSANPFYFFALSISRNARIFDPMSKTKEPAATPQVTDEPGMAERFQRGLQRAFQMPHKPHQPITPKTKTRPVSKGRVHKGKTK